MTRSSSSRKRSKRLSLLAAKSAAASAALLAFPCVAQAQGLWTQSYTTNGTTSASALPENPTQTKTTTQAGGRKNFTWHFQTTYGLSLADVEAPYWNTTVEPAAEAQRSTTGALTQIRHTHSIAMPMEGSLQATRWGVSLVNDRSVARNGLFSALTKDSKTPDWRAWGIGTDVFLVRRMSPVFDIDAGLQADYLVFGVASLGITDPTAPAQSTIQNRLEQKTAWRVTFTGGIGGLYAGPVGLILRLSGYVMQASFKTHSQALRAQGVQLQLGMDLALGRGEQ